MKKFEHKNKDEKRRVLLSKNNELSYAFDNEKLPEENEAVRANSVGVMAKLQNMNKRVLAVVLAIVFVLTVVPTAVFVTVKGAGKKTHITELEASNGAATSLDNTYDGGIICYHHATDDRTYTYNLDEENVKLVPGDTVRFDEEEQKIYWEHNTGAAAAAEGYTNVCAKTNPLMEDISTDEEIANNTFVLSLNAEQALNSGTPYYYESPNGNTYRFEVDGFVGYQESDKVSATDDNTRDYYFKDDPLKTGDDVRITINDPEEGNLSATISGNQMTRHTIYVRKTNSFDSTQKSVFLVGQLMGNQTQVILVNYITDGSGNNTSLKDLSGWHPGDDCQFRSQTIGADKYHVTYNQNPVKNVPLGNQTFYSSNGEVLNSEGFVYIDGESEGQFIYKSSEFQNEATGAGFFYLKGLNGGVFTTDKVFGKIGSNISGTEYEQAYVYDICTAHNHAEAAMWEYSGSGLTIKTSLNSPSQKALRYDTNRAFYFGTNPTTIHLYELTNAYDKDPVEVNVVSTSLTVDEYSHGDLTATDVTYTDNSAVAGNYLEIDKTVKTVDKDNGIYDITLEAYTTAPKLSLPATDIMLVLDTSRNMMNKLYNREYTNLNTFEQFSELDLTNGSITHDDLFDRDVNPRWSRQVLEKIASIFGGDRNYIHNRYVEDPAAPGTYVYLHQWYNLQALILNQYRYYFTSSDGTTYVTKQFTQDVLTTGLSPAPLDEGLEFTATGKPKLQVDKLYTLSNYSGKNSNNNSPATNKNLYSKANSAGRLYIKDDTGAFRRVYVYKDQKANGVAETGMYRYVVYRGTAEGGEVEYEFVTGNKETLNDTTTPASDYGIFQGFRHYKKVGGKLVLDDTKNNLLSKTLYTKVNEEVTALQAMKEAMESFLLNAHKQVVGKDADVYVGLVAYDAGAAVMYGLDENSGVHYTDLAKPVGVNSVDNMIADIYNYRVVQLSDEQKYNIIPTNVAQNNHWLHPFKGTYASEIDYGLETAKNELNDHQHKKKNPETNEWIKSRKYAVLFTAGIPRAYTTNLTGFDVSDRNDFSTTIASGAINQAYQIKNNLEATFYTVGLFDNANETKINGKYWYYETFGQKVLCSGKTGSYWGGSWVSNRFSNIDPKDAYATNRMLAYISSDYMTPRTLGLTRGSFHPGRSGLWGWVSSGAGYRIDQNFNREDTGYYLTVSPTTLIEESENESDAVAPTEDVEAILNDVFQQLITATSSPKNALDADSFLVDGITDYFDLVLDDPDHLPTVVAKYANDAVYEGTDINLKVRYDRDRKPETEGWNGAATNTKAIDVSGFDYSKYWIGTNNTNPQLKLVLTFRVKRTDGLIGGNNIPTNLAKTAIYDGDETMVSDSLPWGLMEERYEIPKVDLPIKMTKFTQDDSIYYGGTENLSDLLNISELQEREITYRDNNKGTLIPNEFVNLTYEYKEDGSLTKKNTYYIPAGATTGTWEDPVQEEPDEDGTPGTVHMDNLEKIFVSPDESTTYKVDVTIEPITKGTVKKDTGNKNKETNIYVFDPHYTTYNGTVANYTSDNEYDLTSTSNKTPMLTEWKYDNAISLGEGETATAKLAEITALLDKDEIPTVTFDLHKYNHPDMEANKKGSLKDMFTVSNNNVTQAVESTNGNLNAYVVNEKHDLIMNNIQVTAVGRDYTVGQAVQNEYYDTIGAVWKIEYLDENDPTRVTKTEFYNANGELVETETEAKANRGTYIDEDGTTEKQIVANDTATPIYGVVTKSYKPSKNADNKTTAENASDHREQVENGKPGKSFTLSTPAHDVTVTNHTVGQTGEADFSDKNHAFPLKFTVVDGNTTLQPGTRISYVYNGDSTEHFAEVAQDGTFVVPLKDGQTATLKEIPDGYTLSITSDLDDHYDFMECKATVGNAAQQTINVSSEVSAPVAVTDDTAIEVKHMIRTVPITGMSDNGFKVNPFIAGAIAVAVAGGAWLAYLAKKRKEGALR